MDSTLTYLCVEGYIQLDFNMRTTICTLQNVLFAYIYQNHSNIAETAILWVLALALTLHIPVNTVRVNLTISLELG